MATFGIESGSVDNRGFGSATGVAKKFKDWVVKTPANHGPGWFIYDDQSTIGTDPYIVVCNQSSPSENSKAIFVQFQVASASELVYLKSYLAWDSTAHTGRLVWQSNNATTKTGAFAYYFRGGEDFLMIILRDGASITHARVSKWVGIWDGTKGTEPESTSGVLANPLFYATDPGGYISNFSTITGYKANLDANGKLYFSIVLVSGSTYRIDIFKDSARTQLIGNTANFTNTSTGSKNITAANSSGLGGTISTGITATAVTNIECRFLRIDLGTGQGAAFRVGKYYFMIDLQSGGSRVNYVQVESKDGDQLVLTAVNPMAFLAGSYISPYPHRWLASGGGGLLGYPSLIPYASVFGNEANPGAGTTTFVFDYMNNTLSNLNPDDEGDYAAQNPWVVESISGRRAWGKELNIVVGAGNGLAGMIDRRIINAKAYIALGVGTVTTLVLDTESLS